MQLESSDLSMIHHPTGFIRKLNSANHLSGTQNGDAQGKTIISTQKIGDGRYTATDQVTLLPGFEATAKDAFLAKIGSVSAYQWQYVLKDHLGNQRALFTDKNGDGLLQQSTDESQNEVLALRNYSAFGLELGGSNQNINYQNPYKYTGKEENSFTGYYDFGARWSDPTVGNRFLSIDPLAEKYYSISPYAYVLNNPVLMIDPDGMASNNAIADCPTCPKDPQYDEYRNSKALYTYDKETGIILTGDGKGATVYGKRSQETTFNNWGHLLGPSLILPAAEFPKSWIGKATVGNASEVTTPISYLSNKLLESEKLQQAFNYSNVMSKRLYTHSRTINGKLVRFKTNLLGRYVGRWLGFGLSRVSIAVTAYDIVDTASTNFQNMTLEEQYQLLQTQQMSGSFIPKELLQKQRESVKKQFNDE